MKSQLLALLDHAYRQEQLFVEGLSDEERFGAGTRERWSAKDTIAHIAAWKERAAQVLAALRSGESGPDFESLDQFNLRIFEEHQDLPWSDVLDKARQAYELLREKTEATPGEVLAAPEPSGPEHEPAWWFVVGVGCTHSLGHLARTYIEQGNAVFALEMQEEAAQLLLQLDGGPDWQVHYGLAGHYAAAGQPEKALAALRRAFRLNPGLVQRAQEDPRLASIVKVETLEFEDHGDTAIEISKYAFYDAEGQELDKGKYIVIWKQDNGQWKLHRDIFNTSMPPPEA